MLLLELDPNEQPQIAYSDPAQTRSFAANLQKDLPNIKVKAEKKAVSPVNYVRILGTDINAVTEYFKRRGFTSIPLTAAQLNVTGKYQNSMLSFNVGGVIYTVVVASSGAGPQEPAGAISVSIKELTPVELGLGGRKFTRDQLVATVRSTVETRFKSRTDLRDVLLSLVDVALGTIPALPAELNNKLTARSRAQISVDFGEILAPIMLMKGRDVAEFPSEANAKLIDVYVGNRGYSVKSLTGSGTSFRSISDLMDRYEESIVDDEEKQELFKLFKAFHPSAGGKNVDKLIKGAEMLGIPEYHKLVQILGTSVENWDQLKDAVAKTIKVGSRTMDYAEFLKTFYPVMTAGGWNKPAGLPADGQYYLGMRSTPAQEKTAGAPSYRANPAKAGADILTYSLGVGLLNSVTQGPDNKKYSAMMTDIVTKSPCYLGKIDLNAQGQLVVSAKPFSELNFRFQYHAPSHLPGNNLPGFMIVY